MTDEELRLRNQRVSTLCEVVAAAFGEAPHSEVLEVLLLIYIAVAKAHPCCAESAEHALTLAGARIHIHRQSGGNLPALTHGAPSSIQ
jgi:hypothetical protein